MRISLVFIFLFSIGKEALGTLPPRYHTYSEMRSALVRLVSTYPNLSRLETLGYSTRFSLPILGLKISDNPRIREDEPRVLFNGVHHAAEIISVEVCLFLAESLLGNYEADPQIKRFVDSLEIWILPMLNPDGHWIVAEGIDTLWRKNLRDNDTNGEINLDYDGVDLNRNYNFEWQRGDSNPRSREYRGPFPFSENEVLAIRDLALREKFVASICYHSHIDPRQGEYVYFPWLWGNSRSPDYFHIRKVAESLALNIVNDANTGTYSYIYGRAEEGGLARNWLYYAVGTFSFTVEVSRGYRPPEHRVDSICRRNLKGAYYLLRRVLGSQIRGRVFDANTREPCVAEVRVLSAYAPPETCLPRYTDSLYGRFFRLLNPGRYAIQVIKDGYETEIETVEVSPGRPTDVEIYLRPSGMEENPSLDKPENSSLIPTIFISRKPGKEGILIYRADGRRIEDLSFLYRSGVYFIETEGRRKKFLILRN